MHMEVERMRVVISTLVATLNFIWLTSAFAIPPAGAFAPCSCYVVTTCLVIGISRMHLTSVIAK